eukprot:CAMPEP_0177265530 /NCGR_PEP_ID=MMETSP0367-20130122/62172_1 /TAXON_ID=447022 ORGANISM="Scrippsiella hangoei-like, Strain SHHI-4" /NCGR_SAMPLE_ID=MMETSP0367 /ASSEMBLY_ACC=CAM_ASM_000362 /LENGTH=122 /DNA_ID=CAMNT_0018720783 /DNA_START=91 /DNA_END=456 /DNA_ORIENTATION=+
MQMPKPIGRKGMPGSASNDLKPSPGSAQVRSETYGSACRRCPAPRRRARPPASNCASSSWPSWGGRSRRRSRVAGQARGGGGILEQGVDVLAAAEVVAGERHLRKNEQPQRPPWVFQVRPPR